MTRIAFVGSGRMAEAILKRIFQDEYVKGEEVALFDIDAARLETMCTTYGARKAESNTDAVQGAEIVLLAVKPQNLEEVLREISPALSADHTVISIAMGKTTSFIEGLLPEGVPVIRVMPNNAAMVGASVSVLSYGSHAGEGPRRTAREIFSHLGEVYEIEENLQDAALAVSGCGPAYFYTMAEIMADAGVRLGMNRSLALKLAVGNMIGAGRMLAETGQHPVLLRDMVTSPGGATILALEVLEEYGFRNALTKAVTAAWKKAREV